MGKPAARLTDMHTCPMVDMVGPVPKPHVGGPITGPGCPTVLIGKLPAVCIGDMAVCVGPPSSIVMGSVGVLIGKKPAARMGDPTAHGGVIVKGEFTVLIGEMSPGPPVIIPPPVIVMNVMIDEKKVTINNSSELKQIVNEGNLTPEMSDIVAQTSVLLESAQNGTPFCEKCEKAKKELEAMDKEDKTPKPKDSPEQQQGYNYVTNPD